MTKLSNKLTAGERALLRDLDKVLAQTSRDEGGLVPALQTTQNLFGYVPDYAMERISEQLRIPMTDVYGVTTFYHFFSLVPRGRFTIRICLGTACYVLGAQEVVDAFCTHLGIEVGETTEDKLFTLETGRCFGACGLAPVIMVNEELHQQVRPDEVPQLIAQYKEQTVSAGGER